MRAVLPREATPAEITAALEAAAAGLVTLRPDAMESLLRAQQEVEQLVEDYLTAEPQGPLYRPMALVRDDQGTIHGLITLEDVLEEIVGDIEDEHDRPTPKLKLRRRPRLPLKPKSPEQKIG